MGVPAKVQDLIDSLEMQNAESAAFLDRETGEVYVISREILRAAEDEMDPQEMRRYGEPQEIELAGAILDDDQRYVALPSSYDIHEWSIMEAFCYSLTDEARRAECLDAIHRRGAFRQFRELVARRRLRDAWFAFRAAALRKIAVEWCEENEVPFVSDS